MPPVTENITQDKHFWTHPYQCRCKSIPRQVDAVYKETKSYEPFLKEKFTLRKFIRKIFNKVI